MGRLSCQRPPIIARPGQHGHGNGSGDALPVMPARELREVVGAHQPDELRAGKPPPELGQRVGRSSCAKIGFECRCHDPASVGEQPGRSQSVGKRGHARLALERISWRDKEPDLVQSQPSQCRPRDMQVSLMRGIETSSEQADPHRPTVAEAR